MRANLKLKTKIAILIGGLATVFVLVAAWVLVISERLHIEEQAHVLAKAVNHAVFEAMRTNMQQGGEPEDNLEFIEFLKEIDVIYDVRVLHGSSIIHQFGLDPGKQPRGDLDERALAGDSVSQELIHMGIPMMHFITPLRLEDDCMTCHEGGPGEIIGAVSVEISLQSAYETLTSRETTGSMIVVIGMAGLALGVSLGIQKLVVGPIKRVGEGAKALSAGDLDYRLPDNLSGDEIGELGRAFNDMANNLSKRSVEIAAKSDSLAKEIVERKRVEADLRTSQSMLEDRVRERTSELKTANQRLSEEILEAERTREALRESEERYALSAKGANDGLWDWDLSSDKVNYSDRWKEMIGCERNEIGDNIEEWIGRVHPDDVEQLKMQISLHLQEVSSHLESEHRVIHKDGSYRWMLSRGLAVRDEQGEAYRMAGSLTDITDRKRAEEQLLHDALHDGLTGLPQRALMMDRLAAAIARAQRADDYSFGVLFLDLDRFKVVNDTLGHFVGDQLLIGVAQRLKATLRAVDTVARLGGDEFLILLDEAKTVRDATRAANRILKALNRPFTIDGHDVYTSASIGIVFGDRDYTDGETVIRDADVAMYRAKELGKARFEVFDRELHAKVLKMLDIEADLRLAISRGEFELHYQPIIELQTNRPTGFEALLRWRHPDRGLLLPGDFMSVAEDSGLIIELGQWVFKEACRQMAAWQTKFGVRPPWSISINISASQLRDPGLAKQVVDIAMESGLEKGTLIIEITENMVVDDTEAAVKVFEELRAHDIKLHLDDFGTGYSALTLLHSLPIDVIKIDRAFISRITHTASDAAIVRAIVDLGHNLGKDIIAEGVETEEEVDALNSMKCRYVQGYFFSKPKDAATIEDMLTNEDTSLTPA